MDTLVVIDQPPYSDWRGRESLDIGFALAAFDQNVSLFFTGPGVYWLLDRQQGEALGQKTLTRQLSAAPMFGVEQLLFDPEACRTAGLDEASLIDQAQPADDPAAMYRRYHHVITL